MKGRFSDRLPVNFKARLICLCVSILVMGFSVALMKAISFGTDPFATINSGIVLHAPISFGTSELLFNGILLIFIFAVDRRQIGIGTVMNMVFLGYVVDASAWLLAAVLPADFFEAAAVRYALLVPSLLLFVFSVGGYMAVELGVSAYDATPVYLEKKITKLSGRMIRILWDVFWVLLGWWLGATVGVITVLMSLLLGPVIAFVKEWFQRIGLVKTN